MWIWTSRGYYSIVQDKENSLFLCVRAHIKGDIHLLFPNATVDEDSGSDYLFRSWIPRGVLVKAIAREVSKVDYPNFKHSVTDHRRWPYLLECWSVMANMQDALEAERGHTEKPADGVD
jgi:hypothetical protein